MIENSLETFEDYIKYNTEFEENTNTAAKYKIQAKIVNDFLASKNQTLLKDMSIADLQNFIGQGNFDDINKYITSVNNTPSYTATALKGTIKRYVEFRKFIYKYHNDVWALANGTFDISDSSWTLSSSAQPNQKNRFEEIKVGDWFFIRSGAREKKVPFNAYGQDVQFMNIWVTGEITKIDGDKLSLEIKNNYLSDKKKWYGRGSNFNGIWKLDIIRNQELCKFIFEPNIKQEYSIQEKYYAIKKVKDGEDDNRETDSGSESAASKTNKGYNKIFYGVPGCGKSYYINKVVLNKLLGSIDDGNEKVDNWEDSEYVFRTIFYQDYSHADFVGQYMPKRDRTTGNLTYEFVPKTFTQALQKAYENPDKNVVLIIEELNRGEAASIFGDLFQLLDRDDNGQSEYKINCDEIVDYLRQKWNKDLKNDDESVSKIKENIKNSGKIYLPSNLYLLATMNTCDQNVFTLDTAFKRRWESEEIPNEFKDSDLKDLYIPYIFTDAQNLSVKITWGDFVEVINDKIKNAIESEFFGDDRQIGCYFVKKSYLCDSTDIYISNYISSIEYKEKSKRFANKILEYLWNDVAKVNKEKWFKSEIKTLHDAISAFEKNKQVFADDLHTELMNTKTTQTVQQQENTEEEVND